MGLLLKIPGIAILLVGGLWGLAICFDIVRSVFGAVVAFLSLIFLPVLMGLAPLYALLSDGDWFPLILNYGSLAVGGGLLAIGSKIDGD